MRALVLAAASVMFSNLHAAETLTSVAMPLPGEWDYRPDMKGRFWLAYYDENRHLHQRDPDGGDRVLRPEDRDQAPSGIAMAPLGESLGVLWRDKLPQKGLYLQDMARPEFSPLELGGGSEPLARIVTSAGKGDLLHLLWLGEKGDTAKNESYHLYYRHLNHQTQTLSPVEQLLPGIYPVMSASAAGDIMVYSWLMDDQPNRIVARYRPADAPGDAPDGGFTEPVTITDVPPITSIFDAFQSGSRWFVVWLAQYGVDQSEFLLEGAHSDDQGKTWQRFAFEDLRGFDIGSLQTATDQAGHILIAVTARKRTSPDLRQDVYLIRSTDRGETWSNAQPLRAGFAPDANQDDETYLQGFHARHPSVIFGSVPGQVLVVWEDWRNIRSGIYASLSQDYGQTWTLSNLPLLHETGTNFTLSQEQSALYLAGDHFQMLAEQSVDDRLKAAKLVRLSFTADDLARSAQAATALQPLDAKAREDALRQRSEGFWQAMLAEDYAKTYEYLDPFSRATFSLQGYQSRMGKIKYTLARLDSVRLNGAKAEVVTTIRASVPAFKAPSTGETITQPEREVPVTNTWLWVDGEWYRQFRDVTQDQVFTHH